MVRFLEHEVCVACLISTLVLFGCKSMAQIVAVRYDIIRFTPTQGGFPGTGIGGRFGRNLRSWRFSWPKIGPLTRSFIISNFHFVANSLYFFEKASLE